MQSKRRKTRQDTKTETDRISVVDFLGSSSKQNKVNLRNGVKRGAEGSQVYFPFGDFIYFFVCFNSLSKYFVFEK